jgi:signal transduction histidine kinase
LPQASGKAVRLTSGAAAIIVGATALLVIGGYGLHQPAWINLAPGLRGMSILTAVGLLAAAASELCALGDKPRWPQTLSKALAGAGLILGVGLLLVHAAARQDTVSPALAHLIFGYEPAIAGRTSPATAACLAMLAIAALNRSRAALADAAAACVLVVAGMAVIGYAYGAQELYAVPVFNTMALHTACAMLLLALASLFARPQAGWAAVITAKGAGGSATRRQLAFMLLPPIAGGLLLRATDAHRLGPGVAMAFLVTVTIVPLALLILRDGRVLEALERERAARADIQSRTAADMQLRLAEQAEILARQSAERTRADAALFRAQRLEALGQLTGGIAHDFNNLLMAIGGNLQLLGRKLELDHPARRYADNAAQAADRGAKLTGQLLAFSRTQKMAIRPVELDPVLRNARDLLGNALGPAIPVQLDLDAPGCWTGADPDQLELAILNLGLNARDAMPDGGHLTLRSRLCRFRQREEDPLADYLSIQVIDTGEGMSPEVAAQAVEPFFTTRPRGKGAGLGLAQVYGFVRQCGGELRIFSEPGEGTIIELLMPRAAPMVQEEIDAPGVLADDARGAGRLVLVIDDDHNVRSVLVDTLRGAGFEVAEAANGEDGLNLLDTVTPSAAIIDFIMPGMNGAEVGRRVQERLPGLPIVFVSGYFDTVALDGISGAVVLRKPFDVEGLNRTVTSLLH